MRVEGCRGGGYRCTSRGEGVQGTGAREDTLRRVGIVGGRFRVKGKRVAGFR